MKRNTLNFWIDFFMLLTVFGLVLTGFLIYYILPPGSGGRGGGSGGLTLWGLSRHDYGDIHFYLALAMLAWAVVHIFLHWKWISASFRNIFQMGKKGRLNPSQRAGVYGVLFILLLTIAGSGLLIWANTQVEGTTHGSGRQTDMSAESPQQPHINGQWTLRDIADSYNLQIPQILEALQLPAAIDPDQRLGPLRQQYGFTMSMVRQLVGELADSPVILKRDSEG